MNVTIVGPDGVTPTAFNGTLLTGSTFITTPGTAQPAFTGAPGAKTFLTGFTVSGLGATAASVIDIFLQYNATSGSSSTTIQTFKSILAIPAGVGVGVTPLIMNFPVPLPYPIVTGPGFIQGWNLYIPTFGAGNVLAAGSLTGFQQ